MYEALKREIDEYADREGFSGVIRVTVREHIAFEYAVGYADREKRLPFDKHSMFTYYSISKPFCAMAMMLLRDRGWIDIDAHPGKYLSEARGFDARVTVRQLMNHSSGVPDFQQSNAFWEQKQCSYTAADLRAQLPGLSRLEPYFAPGTGGHYANINFILCALLIEALTGEGYADFMRREIFSPLGMQTACVDRKGLEIPHRVKGYEPKNGDLSEIVEAPKAYEWMFGAGDVVGTVDDLYCLNRAIKNKNLISEQSWREILTVSPASRMGLGCTVYEWHGKTRIQHNGGSSGFRTLHVQLPKDDFDLILLSNFGYGNAREVLAETVHKHFYGEVGAFGKGIEMDRGYI